MKIIERSPHVLVVRDTAPVLRWMGAGMCAFGGLVRWIAVENAAGDAPDAVPAAFSLLLALGGVLLMVLPTVTTFAIDVRARVLVTTRRALLRRRSQTEVALRDVAAVEVEQSTDGEGGKMYRLVTRLKSGGKIPWTGYLTGFGHGTMRTIADAAGELLELPKETAAPLPTRGAPIAPPPGRGGRKLLAAFGLFTFPFLGFGVHAVWREQRSLMTFRPVTAEVSETRVESRSDSEGSSYAPVVTYRYVVDGRTYVSSRTTPLNESGGARWARRITSRFEPGAHYTAYYDPDEPANAFLVRDRSAAPWAFVGIPLVPVLLIAAAARKKAE